MTFAGIVSPRRAGCEHAGGESRQAVMLVGAAALVLLRWRGVVLGWNAKPADLPVCCRHTTVVSRQQGCCLAMELTVLLP